MPFLRFSIPLTISLARQLLIDNFENVRRINKHLLLDTDSPTYQKSHLSLLISVFRDTNAELVKMEIARLLTVICRVSTSPTQNIDDVDRRRKKFFAKHPDIGLPISFMVSQQKWPLVRSEGWFVLALMVWCPEGVHCVADILHETRVFQSLVEILTGRSIADKQPAIAEESPTSEERLLRGRLSGTPMASSSPEMEMIRIN
jgi:hypothetical protein